MKKLILFILISSSLGGCVFPLAPPCEDTIKGETRSPNGKYIATVFERNCGATAPFVTYVNLRASSAKFNSDEGIVLVVKGQPKIHLSWKDSTSLQIECPECNSSEIYEQQKSWNGVQIFINSATVPQGRHSGL